jgi:hypothetical protein
MPSSAAVVLLAALQSVPAPAPRVVERVMAVVDGRPVLLSEVRAAQAVRGEDEAQALESVIDEMLMFAEAARLPQAVLSEDEETRALDALLARGAATADGEALRRMARRQATILKYVDFRFRPQVRVGVEDVERALEAGRAADESAEARPAREAEARRVLEAEDLDRRIEAWVAELRKAAPVRYNARGR